MLKKIGFSDKDIIEIKTGYKVIVDVLVNFLTVAIPSVAIIGVSHHYGVHHYVFAGFLFLCLATFFFFLTTAYAQYLGQEKLAEKEVKTFERSDGSTGSYVVYKKENRK